MSQIGISSDLDRVFTQVCLLMANEPAYQEMPIKRLPELLSAISAKKYLMLVEQGDIQAVLLWQNLAEDTAQQLIAEQRMPSANDLCTEGKAYVATCLLGRNPSAVTRLWRSFTHDRRDQIILYERHYHGTTEEAIREFRALGPDLEEKP